MHKHPLSKYKLIRNSSIRSVLNVTHTHTHTYVHTHNFRIIHTHIHHIFSLDNFRYSGRLKKSLDALRMRRDFCNGGLACAVVWVSSTCWLLLSFSSSVTAGTSTFLSLLHLFIYFILSFF